MKRSTNLSHTRKPRKPMSDAAKFLRDLGYTDEQIIATLFPVQNAQPTLEINEPQPADPPWGLDERPSD